MVKLQPISTPSSQTTTTKSSNTTSPTSSNQSSPTSLLPPHPPTEFTMLPFLPLPHNHYPPQQTPFYHHQQPQQPPLVYYQPYPFHNNYYPQQQQQPMFYYHSYRQQEQQQNAGFYYHPQVYYPQNAPGEFYDAMHPTTRGPRFRRRVPMGKSFYHGGNVKGNGNGNFHEVVVKKVWKPKERKSSEKGKNGQENPITFTNLPAELANCTTIMVKNIPNCLRRDKFMQLLDRHCREQNVKKDKDDESQSQYDFVYLPFDFVKGQNLGYAFINMTSMEGVAKLYTCWNNKGWFSATPKIREITPAKLQGLAQCRKHFHASVFVCNTDAFLPLEFSPPRNGFNGDKCEAKTIGKWVYVNRLMKSCSNEEEGTLAKTNQPYRPRRNKTINPMRLSRISVN